MITVGYDGRDASFPATAAPVTVGRSLATDFVVVDVRVSRRHLEIASREDGWHVTDVGTENGTWADGRPWTTGRVRDELRLRLGHPDDGPLLVFTVPRATGTPPPSSVTTDLSELAMTTGAMPGEPELPREPIRLRDGLTIGRDTGNDVVLTDLLVSRRHVVIHRSPGGLYTVQDRGATNRTFVDGDPVRCHDGGAAGIPLHDMGVLTVGRVRLMRAEDKLYPLPPMRESGLDVTDVSYRLPGGRTLVSGLTFGVRGPKLVAVIGPSGAGKSTLLRLLAGALAPSTGEVRYRDGDVTRNAEVRQMIGVVPQQTVAHGRLRVGDALRYAAELRLPSDLPAAERAARVGDVLAELSLTEHAQTRVDRLSGGQQRRLAIGFELLTRPSLLLVDEPTAGLDPALVRQVMQLLRALADGGRQVVVTTHELSHLDTCDQVIALAPGGRAVFDDRPDKLAQRFGTTDWADIYERLAAAPAPAAGAPAGPAPAARPRRLPAADLTSAAVRRRIGGQAWVVVRRQLRLLAADPAYLALHTGLPVFLALLALTVPGGRGFAGAGDPAGSAEAARLLVVLVVGAAFIGMAAPSRDLVGERPVYLHERAAGLLPEAYLLAKLAVFAGIAVVQSFVLVVLLGLFRAAPAQATLLGSPTLELAVGVAATAAACAALGLAASARVATLEQATVPLVLAVMAQFVLCGGIIPIAGRALLQPFSWLTPGRWGYAATAATVGLRTPHHDPLWTHSAIAWLGALLALALLTLVSCCYARRVLRGQPG